MTDVRTIGEWKNQISPHPFMKATGRYTNKSCQTISIKHWSVADWVKAMSASFEWVLTNPETFDTIGTFVFGDDRFRVFISGFSKNIWAFHSLDRALTIGLFTTWVCRTPSVTLSEVMGISPRSGASGVSHAILSDDSPRRHSPRSFPGWQYSDSWRDSDEYEYSPSFFP